MINIPLGFLIGPDRGVFFSDFNNHRLRYIAPNGTISTVAGNGSGGVFENGPSLIASQTICSFLSVLWRRDPCETSKVRYVRVFPTSSAIDDSPSRIAVSISQRESYQVRLSLR